MSLGRAALRFVILLDRWPILCYSTALTLTLVGCFINASALWARDKDKGQGGERERLDKHKTLVYGMLRVGDEIVRTRTHTQHLD